MGDLLDPCVSESVTHLMHCMYTALCVWLCVCVCDCVCVWGWVCVCVCLAYTAIVLSCLVRQSWSTCLNYSLGLTTSLYAYFHVTTKQRINSLMCVCVCKCVGDRNMHYCRVHCTGHQLLLYSLILMCWIINSPQQLVSSGGLLD